ncbi:hypothetical protein GW17_00050215 [Ensete ventricosum]|nr:hypothetical protein GW17_00050215 [Ensete ventricosum]
MGGSPLRCPAASHPCGCRAVSGCARGLLPPLRASRSLPCPWKAIAHAGGRLRATTSASDRLQASNRPLYREPWPQPAVSTVDLAVDGCPYKVPSHGWPPLQGVWPWLAAPPRCIGQWYHLNTVSQVVSGGGTIEASSATARAQSLRLLGGYAH